MRLLALLLLSSLASDALAFRGRPVSDYRFEGRSAHSPSIDSDGTDFLVFDNGSTQKVVNGQPIGPVNPAGAGADDHVWTGTHYLAASSRWLARVSREGSLLSERIEIFSEIGESFVVANGSSALAFTRTWTDLRVRPVSLDGHPTGPEQILPPVPFQGPSPIGPGLAAAGNRFAAAVPSETSVELFLLRPDGSVDRTVSIPRPAGYDRSSQAFVASDGSELLVMFAASRFSGGSALVTAVVRLDGTIRHTATIGNGQFHSFFQVGLVWAASQYVILGDLASFTGQFPTPAALLRLTRDGELSGEPVPLPGHNRAWDLAWNGRDLAVVTDSGVSSVDLAMRVSPPVLLGRTLSEQAPIALAPGPAGYLAAWTERDSGAATVRASRIDAAGNYLDGAGIVLGTAPGASILLIDGNGPHWLVAWVADGVVRARTLSFNGVPGAPAIAIGNGFPSDVVWRGAHYVLLRRAANNDHHADTLRPDGTLLSTRLVLAATQIATNITYAEGARLLALNDRLLMVYGAVTQNCHVFCSGPRIISALSVDPPETTPFVIDGQRTNAHLHDVATDGTRGLVAYADGNGVYGAFVTGTQAGPPFTLHGDFSNVRVARDGTGFVAVIGTFTKPMTAGRVQLNGTFTGAITATHHGDAEPRDLAASATLPPLVAFGRFSRGEMLFTSEFTPPAAPPPAPRIVCATENADGTITVLWQQASNALGVAIELQLSDATFREIAVAPANATSARISRWGLLGNAVRVRAWNGSGYSQPSAIAPTGSGPQATLRSAQRACAGKPVTITYTLSGVAPFTVRWSDGLVQTSQTANASRTVTTVRDITLSIVSVSHASCGVDETVRSVRILVDQAASIDDQPREVQIPRGQTATLTIDAGDDFDFAWFEGNRGDTTKPVGTNDPSFTTPALQATTRYWVRVSNRCGSVESDPIVVVVTGGKGRAVRK